jgi:hypothetical protein
MEAAWPWGNGAAAARTASQTKANARAEAADPQADFRQAIIQSADISVSIQLSQGAKMGTFLFSLFI